MQYYLSPKYTHEKLDSRDTSDYVDVFEDTWRRYILEPSRWLLEGPNGDVAAMLVLSSYFEAIWSFLSGQDTTGKSKASFVKGFCQVFSSTDPNVATAAEAVYEHVRCGLAHDGLLRQKVNYSRVGANALYLTYPKKPDGSLDVNRPVESIIVNPSRFYLAIERHFNDYIRRLRDATDAELLLAFRDRFERQWGVGAPDNVVGMTEREFRGEA
jgi:hypothetical protein